MMAAPQHPPQQPSYSDQLNFALDRQYNRITDYVDALIDKVLTYLRTDRQESLARDDALLKRIENVEATQKVII